MNKPFQILAHFKTIEDVAIASNLIFKDLTKEASTSEIEGVGSNMIYIKNTQAGKDMSKVFDYFVKKLTGSKGFYSFEVRVL